MMDWSDQLDRFDTNMEKWFDPGSNMMLDFHGDPRNAEFVLFSDGNHHMALKETMEKFRQKILDGKDIFFTTTPPAPLVRLVEGEKLQIGNLVLCLTPHVFMGPGHVLDSLVRKGYMEEYQPFVRNQGSVLLVQKENPKEIRSIHDLEREDITVFISNPEREGASFEGYRDTLVNLSGYGDMMNRIRVVYGKTIHHREAPEAVFLGEADAAILYYHLALHYTRQFPETFRIVPLTESPVSESPVAESPEQPDPAAGNITGTTYAGTISGGGRHGDRFLEFLGTEEVKEIYRLHGLVPVCE